MKTRLFTEDTESYTLEANQIANEFDRAIKAVFDKYSDMYYARELEVIALTSVSMNACRSVLDQQHSANEKRNAEMAKNLADPNLAEKVKDYVRAEFPQNQRGLIPTIKALRILTGIGLKEGRDWVEANLEFTKDYLLKLD